jgi:hypothetical protein
MVVSLIVPTTWRMCSTLILALPVCVVGVGVRVGGWVGGCGDADG